MSETSIERDIRWFRRRRSHSTVTTYNVIAFFPENGWKVLEINTKSIKAARKFSKKYQSMKHQPSVISKTVTKQTTSYVK